MGNKIVVNEKIFSDVLASNKSFNEVLYKTYSGDIADKIKENPALFSDMSPIKMALYDAGISGSSIIKDFTTANASEYLLPAFIDTRLRESVAKSDMLSYVVSGSVGVDGLSVVAASLDLEDTNNKDNIKKKRVAEGADIPLATLKLGDQALTMFKHGRAVQATYEALQYLRVDLFSKAIDLIANDVAGQQMGDAIDVLVKGDGNNNAASSQETSTAGIVTNDDLIDMIISFQEKSGLPVTTIIASKNFFKQMFKLVYSTSNASGADERFTISTPQFNGQNINLIYDNRVPQATGNKEQAIFLNKDNALIKYIANGSNVREIQTNIRNQTRLGTISEISAFAKFDKNAAMLLVSK